MAVIPSQMLSVCDMMLVARPGLILSASRGKVLDNVINESKFAAVSILKKVIFSFLSCTFQFVRFLVFPICRICQVFPCLIFATDLRVRHVQS